jgi:hypothetical protein
MRSEARSEKSELGQARRKVVLRVFFMVRRATCCPDPGASAPGCSAVLHPSTAAGTTRADAAHIFPAPPRRRLHRQRRVRPSPRARTPPQRRLRFYTRPTMHYTSFAMRPAYSFQIPVGGKGTLGGSPGREEAGRGRAGWGRRDLQRESNGGADNGPIQRSSA